MALPGQGYRLDIGEPAGSPTETPTMLARLIVLSAALLATTTAAADPARTLDGVRVETEAFVMVSWSMNNPADLARLRSLSGCSKVLAVNTDAPQEHSRLRPLLRAQGIELAVVTDPDGQHLPEAMPTAALLARDAMLACACAPTDSADLQVCDAQPDLRGR
ncbi:MAG: hypothetical protein ACI8RZ_002403 [Myxococcota bacterium]|jgi:hypothetical protein